MNKLTHSLAALICVSSTALAAEKPIIGAFNKKPATGTSLIAVSANGRSAAGTITGKKFSVVPPSASARLYLLNGGKVSGQMVLSRCKNIKGTKTINRKTCSKSKVFTSFKAGRKIGTVSQSGLAYVLRSASLSPVVATDQATASNFVPVGLSTLGLGTGSAGVSRAVVALAEAGSDGDQDGLVDALDIDDNGNGVIDNYDSTTTASTSSDSFRVFSNLKLDLAQSLNLHATGSLPTASIDTALQDVQTLAIQVAGSTGETTELDCGSLSYCSSGGTGLSNSLAFPGTAGGSFDPDSDGFGTITKGGTGDFQLQTKATSAAISAGDTLIERITAADGTERQIPGVLNFVFNSTPALKTVIVNGGAEQTIDYAATPRLGSRQNCIQVPSSGNVALTITGWRPQRPGVSAAGEGAFVDIGKSLITIDIPNGPITSGSSSGGSNGPGNCVASAYSVTSDPNLTVSTNGLQDGKSDIDAVSSNTYTFTIDVTSCLNNAPSGAISWPSNTELYLDLQFRSKDGDNAAQKFCLARPAVS
jgi:hypothetical protein